MDALTVLQSVSPDAPRMLRQTATRFWRVAYLGAVSACNPPLGNPLDSRAYQAGFCLPIVHRTEPVVHHLFVCGCRLPRLVEWWSRSGWGRGERGGCSLLAEDRGHPPNSSIVSMLISTPRRRNGWPAALILARRFRATGQRPTRRRGTASLRICTCLQSVNSDWNTQRRTLRKGRTVPRVRAR